MPIVNPKINVPEIAHFTGEKRDIGQLKAVYNHLKDDKTIIFIGCSKGDEILDFQGLNDKDLNYFGVDYDKETVELANKNNYLFPTKILTADILKDDFLDVIKENAKLNRFDIVICRNLLIYYDNESAKAMVEKLADLTDNLLILGISDPFCFLVNKDKVKIGNNLFEIIDFDNRIFKRL